MTTRFRNVDASPADVVETWPIEAVQAALERGSLREWRRLAAAVRRDPWGTVARDVEYVLTYARPYGVAELMTRVIGRERAAVAGSAREEVAQNLRAMVRDSGLAKAEFARRLGTSPSRLSTYLSGAVTPSAALYVRASRLGDPQRSQRPGVISSPSS